MKTSSPKILLTLLLFLVFFVSKGNDSTRIALLSTPPVLNGKDDLVKLKDYRKLLEKEGYHSFYNFNAIADSALPLYRNAYEAIKIQGNKEDERFYRSLWVISHKGKTEYPQEARLFLNNDYYREHPISLGINRNLIMHYMHLEQYEYVLEFMTEYEILLEKHKGNDGADNGIVPWFRPLVYFRIGNYEKALEAYKIRLGLKFEGLGGQNRVFKLHDVGQCYAKLNNWDSATWYYQKALSELETHEIKEDKPEYDFYMAMIEQSISEKYYLTKEYDKLIPALQKLLKAAREIGDENQIQLSSYKLAEIYYRKSQFNTANGYLDRLLVHLRTANFSKANYQEALKLKSRIYFGKGNKRVADHYTAQLNAFNDSMKEESAQNIVANSQVKSLLHTREREVRLEKEAKEQSQRRLIISFISLLALTILAGISFIAYRKNKKKKDLISLQNEMLNQSVEDKEMLMREIHHRVKNNLQVIIGLLQIQSSAADNEEVKQALSQSRKRLFSISSIHELLYENNKVESVEMQPYVEKIMSQNLQIQDQKITHKINTDDIFLEMDTAIPLGLMLNELITNSFKHAFIGIVDAEINIVLTRQIKDDCNYVLQYMDNGMGIHPDKKSLGLRIIDMMGRQLKAKISQPEIESGFEMVVRF